MVIKTKKTKLDKNNYIKLGVKNILKDQWWIFLICLGLMLPTFWVKTIWFIIIGVMSVFLYSLFWVIQFYGVTYLDQNKLLFESVRYEISSKYILMQISSKQGSPIGWDQIKKAYMTKTYFLLVISKVHFVYLPHKLFNSENDAKFFESILKRKNLL